jgi:hypothetical protein
LSFITPAAEQAKAEIEARFEGIVFGIYKRRPIANSTRWSQHSWPNALDITYGGYGNTSPEAQAALDKVHAWLRANFSRLGIRTLLWRVKSHYDHIHVDFWPEGYGTPSLTRGGSDNRYRLPNGQIITQAELTQEDEDVLRNGDGGLRVKAVQEQLIAIGYSLPEYGADGDFGDETEAAVKQFQTDRGLEPDGILRAIDMSLLFRVSVSLHKDRVARKEARRANERLDTIKEAL